MASRKRMLPQKKDWPMLIVTVASAPAASRMDHSTNSASIKARNNSSHKPSNYRISNLHRISRLITSSNNTRQSHPRRRLSLKHYLKGLRQTPAYLVAATPGPML